MKHVNQELKDGDLQESHCFEHYVQALKVQGCGQLDTPCSQSWAQLDQTNDQQVRFCEACCKPVFMVHDESEVNVARGNPYVSYD